MATLCLNHSGILSVNQSKVCYCTHHNLNCTCLAEDCPGTSVAAKVLLWYLSFRENFANGGVPYFKIKVCHVYRYRCRVLRALVPRSVILDASTIQYWRFVLLLLLLLLQQSIVQDTTVPTAPHSNKKLSCFPELKLTLNAYSTQFVKPSATIKITITHTSTYRTHALQNSEGKKYKNRGIYRDQNAGQYKQRRNVTIKIKYSRGKKTKMQLLTTINSHKTSCNNNKKHLN